MHNSLCLGFRESHPSPWGYIIKGKFSTHLCVYINSFTANPENFK